MRGLVLAERARVVGRSNDGGGQGVGAGHGQAGAVAEERHARGGVAEQRDAAIAGYRVIVPYLRGSGTTRL